MINSLSTTVNQLLLATTLFYDLSELNWFAVTNFCDQRFIHTCISITLVRSDKYSWKWGSCEPRENLLHENNNWFTVLKTFLYTSNYFYVSAINLKKKRKFMFQKTEQKVNVNKIIWLIKILIKFIMFCRNV